MEIVIGRRYRVTNNGGASEVVTAEADWEGDVFLPVTVMSGYTRLWLRINGKTSDHSRLCRIELLSDEAPPPPRPILGDDPGALLDLRRTFADWDFSVGTY